METVELYPSHVLKFSFVMVPNEVKFTRISQGTDLGLCNPHDSGWHQP